MVSFILFSSLWFFFGTFVAGMTLRLFFVCIDLMDLELLIEEKQIALNSIVGLWRVNQAHLEFPKKWVIQSFHGWYDALAALAAAATSGSGNFPYFLDFFLNILDFFLTFLDFFQEVGHSKFSRLVCGSTGCCRW